MIDGGDDGGGLRITGMSGSAKKKLSLFGLGGELERVGAI